MIVSDLFKKLAAFPADAEVKIVFWDDEGDNELDCSIEAVEFDADENVVFLKENV